MVVNNNSLSIVKLKQIKTLANTTPEATREQASSLQLLADNSTDAKRAYVTLDQKSAISVRSLVNNLDSQIEQKGGETRNVDLDLKVAQSLMNLEFRNSMKEFLADQIQVNPRFLKQEFSKVKINQTPVKRHFSLRPKFAKMPVYNLDQVSL